MTNSNVEKTRELDLCVSCEICLAACPFGAIEMEYEKGQFLPKINKDKCTNCGVCFEVCPGINVDNTLEGFSIERLNTPYLKAYTAYSKNLNIRKESTSGGLITDLIIELINKKEFDYAFVLKFDKFQNKPARLEQTDNPAKIIDSSKSKYIPASVYEVVKTIKNNPTKKHIIIGTPCQFIGIKKFMKKFNISKENILFLGLFCEKTLNFNILDYYENKYKNSNEKINKFNFRDKQKGGWPGDSKLVFDSDRTRFITRGVRMQIKNYFQLNRCLFCLDKLNIHSDIAFGDCYIKGKGDHWGKSDIIIRTEKGKQIFDKYSYLFNYEKADIKKIIKSQNLEGKKQNFEFLKIHENKHYSKNNKINYHIEKKLVELQKKIKKGQTSEFDKIKPNLRVFNAVMKARKMKKLAKHGFALGIIGLTTGFFILRDLFKKIKSPEKNTKPNIIIVGGGLFNKGAQAMTFTAIDQIKRRFPDKKIYLFSSNDFNLEETKKRKYNFSIFPWDLITRFRLASGTKLFKKASHYSIKEQELKEIIKNSEAFIDISGYALSSQFGLLSSFNYLLNIIISKKHNIPYYIFPQSLGPFNYFFLSKPIIMPLIKHYLKYPEKIYARETEGFDFVNKFNNNVEHSMDIVLQTRDYELFNIYKEKIEFKNIKIDSNSVGIIPNLRVIERVDKEKIFAIYKSVIRTLLEYKKTVYILRHSYEDLEICQKIKSFFNDKENVKLIHYDLNSIELENLIKQFDFVIASRYHSIIHSYKNGIPAIGIGWAVKYYELLDKFGQLTYFYDSIKNLNIENIKTGLKQMIYNHNQEKEKILNKFNILSQNNIFDELFTNYNK